MSRLSRSAVMFATAAAATAVVGAPSAVAEPIQGDGGQSAEATIDDLTAQGYNVQINWVNRFDTKPLSECWMTGVNNPGDETPTGGTFVTVYVDVRCPNGNDDGGYFRIGVGIG
jgi:hypothetical protein